MDSEPEVPMFVTNKAVAASRFSFIRFLKTESLESHRIIIRQDIEVIPKDLEGLNRVL